jgi:hypothetical protein
MVYQTQGTRFCGVSDLRNQILWCIRPKEPDSVVYQTEGTRSCGVSDPAESDSVGYQTIRIRF